MRLLSAPFDPFGIEGYSESVDEIYSALCAGPLRGARPVVIFEATAGSSNSWVYKRWTENASSTRL